MANNKYGAFNADIDQSNRQHLNVNPVNTNNVQIIEPIPVQHDELIQLMYVIIALLAIMLLLKLYSSGRKLWKKNVAKAAKKNTGQNEP